MPDGRIYYIALVNGQLLQFCLCFSMLALDYCALGYVLELVLHGTFGYILNRDTD